jgi:hypothetical protein
MVSTLVAALVVSVALDLVLGAGLLMGRRIVRMERDESDLAALRALEGFLAEAEPVAPRLVIEGSAERVA